MDKQKTWSTEIYKGMEVHVTSLAKQNESNLWDYTVRICEPGVDAGSASELIISSGDDADFSSSEEALAAGFKKGYDLVDNLK